MSSVSRYGAAAIAGLTAVVLAAGVWHSRAAGPAAPAAIGAAPPADQAAAPDPRVLRVCVDPNNLPFTNERREGFENQIADLVARDLGRTVEYYWQPQRRGFLRTTIQSHLCDVVMSVPSTLDRIRATRPYYRSSYVFVSRRDRRLDIQSFDDPRLRRLDIGIPIVGEDYENPPPAQALAARRIFDRVHGYTVYGDYSRPMPQRTIVDAVATGDVDIAVVWGPLAGYLAREARVPLALAPVRRHVGVDLAPFAFDMSVGVRRDDAALADAIDATLARRAGDIRRILESFGVPLVGKEAGA
jgi:mxaJ protein